MNRAPKSDAKTGNASNAGKRKVGKQAKKKPRGRPTKLTPAVARKIIDGLSLGTPLTIICKPKGMPSDRTVRDWMGKTPTFSADIASAREAGFDRIALDALAIADEVTDKDTITFTRGDAVIEMPNKEWLLRSKLRVDTRLKLLAKWDPKRYGEKITQEISGPDGGPVQTEGDFRPSADDEAVIRRIAEARANLTQSKAPK